MRYLLLLATFFMVFITYESFVFVGILKRIPYSHLAKAIGLTQKSISLKAQNEVKEYYHRQFIIVPIAALAATYFIAKLTYEAFSS